MIMKTKSIEKLVRGYLKTVLIVFLVLMWSSFLHRWASTQLYFHPMWKLNFNKIAWARRRASQRQCMNVTEANIPLNTVPYDGSTEQYYSAALYRFCLSCLPIKVPPLKAVQQIWRSAMRCSAVWMKIFISWNLFAGASSTYIIGKWESNIA